MKISSRAPYFVAALAVPLLVGCSSGGSPDTSQPTSTAGGSSSESSSPAIVIQDFAFKGPVSVAAGATISVSNLDSQEHSVTADDGSFDVVVHVNGTATLTAPSEPGSYEYHCSFHPNMRGTLVVS